MAYLIGLLMTQFPFAAAAAALVSDDARAHFATLCRIYLNARPEVVRFMVEKRYGTAR